jgi:hypothetical protein
MSTRLRLLAIGAGVACVISAACEPVRTSPLYRGSVSPFGEFAHVVTYALLSDVDRETGVRMDDNKWYWRLDFDELGDAYLAEQLASRILRDVPPTATGTDTLSAVRMVGISLRKPVFWRDSARITVVWEDAIAYRFPDDATCFWDRQTTSYDYRLLRNIVWELAGTSDRREFRPWRPQNIDNCRRN